MLEKTAIEETVFWGTPFVQMIEGTRFGIREGQNLFSYRES